MIVIAANSFGLESEMQVKLTDDRPRIAATATREKQAGRSIVETMMVITIAGILISVAVPQMISARRLLRTSSMAREMATQMRFARQQSMTQRQAFTFQYDNSTKTVKIFDHNNANNASAGCNMTGVQVLAASGYPNTVCTTLVSTIPLATGTFASELTYGIPSGISNTTLDDGNTLTALSGTGLVNITFQPDGTVVDNTGAFTTATLFFYNNQVPTQTASAISVLGAAGRVKVWRYSTSANKFAE
jgi:Tfp pilus assembly protein FimT